MQCVDRKCTPSTYSDHSFSPSPKSNSPTLSNQQQQNSNRPKTPNQQKQSNRGKSNIRVQGPHSYFYQNTPHSIRGARSHSLSRLQLPPPTTDQISPKDPRTPPTQSAVVSKCVQRAKTRYISILQIISISNCNKNGFKMALKCKMQQIPSQENDEQIHLKIPRHFHFKKIQVFRSKCNIYSVSGTQLVNATRRCASVSRNTTLFRRTRPRHMSILSAMETPSASIQIRTVCEYIVSMLTHCDLVHILMVIIRSNDLV